jgi:hypothetical protein
MRRRVLVSTTVYDRLREASLPSGAGGLAGAKAPGLSNNREAMFRSVTLVSERIFKLLTPSKGGLNGHEMLFPENGDRAFTRYVILLPYQNKRSWQRRGTNCHHELT